MRRMIRSVLISAMFFTATAGVFAGRVQAEQASCKAVTVVILPPHLKVKDPKTRMVAELLCDRLAEELGKAKTILVVDRAQIDRILQERKIESHPPKPMLAYDLMARVSVDTIRPVPRVRLVLIDLSMGNIVKSREYPWKKALDPKQLADMAELCGLAAKVAASPGKRLKVRLPGVIIAEKAARLEPLGQRLQRTFEQSLIRSPKVCMVRHLEAATSKEESLLLLMGMSRLPGERRFAPQAHVTVELRLREIDAIGKTFDQTTVQIGFRVEKGAPGKWASMKGKVADWDNLMQSAWRAISKDLSEADPQAAADFLNEMAVRRRQAEAELDKLSNMGGINFSAIDSFPHVDDFKHNAFQYARLKSMAQTAAAAAKIDPTCRKAAQLSLTLHFLLRRYEGLRDRADMQKTMTPVVRDALRYFSTFRGGGHSHRVLDVPCAATCWMLSPRYASGPPSPEVVDRIKQLADLVVPERVYPSKDRWENGRTIKLIYENMLAVKMPPDLCRQWRDRSIRLIVTKVLDARKRGLIHSRDFELWFSSLRYIAIKYAIDEGDPGKARKLLVDLMREIPDPTHIYNDVDLVKQAKRLKDPHLAVQVRKWGKDRHNYRVGVQILSVRWPLSLLYKDLRPPVVPGKVLHAKFKVKPEFVKKREVYVEAIAAGEGRLYVLFTTAYWYLLGRGDTVGAGVKGGARFGYVPLDEDGALAGEEIIVLPQPSPARKTRVSAAEVLAGRLCVGTEGSGILVYDPKRNEWKTYGAEQGLPHWKVCQFHRLDDHTLLCFGGDFRLTIVYALDIKSGRITLLQKTSEKKWGGSSHGRIAGVWRVGRKWFGVHRMGLIEDLLGPRLTVRPWPKSTPHALGWERISVGRPLGYYPLSMATVKDRRFVAFPDALREINNTGKTLRVWPIDCRIRLKGASWLFSSDVLAYHRFPVPGEIPGVVLLGHDETYLFFVNSRGLVCFDPANDTWYGPVAIQIDKGARLLPRHTNFVTQRGIWCGKVYVAKADIIAAARKADLVATSEQIKKRRQKIIDAASPLDRAKFAFTLHQFDKAKGLLARVLKEDPNNPEAMIVMGLLHDRFCLNEPNVALAYYERLTGLADNPSATLAGMYLQCDWYMRANEPAKALKIGREMLRRFRIYRHHQLGVQGMVTKIAARIEATTRTPTTQKGVKQPAPATSK